MENLLIFKPFNFMFFALVALTAVFGFFFIRTFRGRDIAVRKRAVIILYSAVLVLLVVYKIMLSFDAEYSRLRVEEGLTPFMWIEELPLNLCNINIWLIIIAVATGSRPLLSFNFFFGTLGAIFPVLMPVTGFSGYSILLPRMIGYYGTHFLIWLQTPILAGLDLYKPKYRDVAPSLITFVSLAAVMTAFNLIMRATGIGPRCNYFYTMEPVGVPLITPLYELIRIPLLYLMPMLPVGIAYVLGITFIFERRRAKEEAQVK